MIDAFCSKTATWYASKVLSTKDSTDGVLIKVMYTTTIPADVVVMT